MSAEELRKVMFSILLAVVLFHASATTPTIEELTDTVAHLSQQMRMQQLVMEERVRTSGDSGLKVIRLMRAGTNPYVTESHTLNSAMSMHDHTNNIRTIGLGELAAVLNGVEFRTRHNDYRLYMPSTNSSGYGEYREIPFPPVPPSVTALTSIDDQVAEMKRYFKAFNKQNHTNIDYRPYFKAVLCYLEGAWMFPDGPDIEEPFQSDRHHLDADTWSDLLEKIRFTSATGTKSNLENYAFLPTKIVDDDKSAQWNYRIMCHPLSQDLPTDSFKLIDDFHSRMYFQNNVQEQEMKRAARFAIKPDRDNPWPTAESEYSSGLIDELMYEIPGKDNYPANITDDAFKMVTTTTNDGNAALNAGYYHRSFRTNKKGAMGISLVFRGFQDLNMYTALNSQDKIMSVKATECRRRCLEYEQRVSYAIPLEIIYLTPLSEWNPYGIEYKGDWESPEAVSVTDGDNRDGATTERTLNGTHSKLYYRTPFEFFSGGEVNSNAADTTSPSLYVLDGNGDPQRVPASGSRIILPNIGDFGNTRLRYPIFPVHEEGSGTRKELEAVKEAFLELGDYMHMLRKQPTLSTGTSDASGTTSEPSNRVLQLGVSESTSVEQHQHTIQLTSQELQALDRGDALTKDTSIAVGHNHAITFIKNNRGRYIMTSCGDPTTARCWDRHPLRMTLLDP